MTKEFGPVIAMVAGEASGDTLGAHLMTALRTRYPNAVFIGIGGPKMISAGFDSWYPQERLAVRGLVEVLRHIRGLHRIRTDLVSRLRKARPRLFVGIDAPDFNLGLEQRIKNSGITTVHYVSPTIWAWRPGRIKGIARAVSHMLVLFPFEQKLYAKAGIPVSYVGHPLADEIPLSMPKAAARQELRIPAEATVIALLPGSRQSEIEQMAQPFIETAKRIHASRPEVRFLAPFATRETRDGFEREIYKLDARDLPLSMMFGHAHEAMAAADVVLVASGTATLEAALVKRPMVVSYRLAPITFRIARRLVKIPYVALPNILAGEFLVPEFLQEEATSTNLAQALLTLIDDRALHAPLTERFEAMHRELRQGTADRAADALSALIEAASKNAA